MEKSFLVSLSWHFYRLLLLLYPASFRQEFGREISLAFRDYCRLVTRRDGLIGLFELLLTTTVDLIATASVERIKEITHMSQRTISRLFGAIGALGGLYLLVIGTSGLGGNDFENILSPLMPLYAIGLLIGVIGLYIYLGNLADGVKTSITITFGGTVIMALGIGLLIWLDAEGSWNLWIGGHLLHALGLLLFGLTVQGVPTFWKALPSLIGALAFILFLIASSTESAVFGGIWFIIQGLGWVLLGGMVVTGIKTHPTGPHPAIGV